MDIPSGHGRQPGHTHDLLFSKERNIIHDMNIIYHLRAVTLIGQICLAGAVTAPLAAAAISLTGSGLAGCRKASRLGWASAAAAVIATIVVALNGPYTLTLNAIHGNPVFGLIANQLTVTLLLLVCVVGALVQSFAGRYLQTDRSAPKFFAATNAVVASMAIVCTSATVALLVAAWVAAGLAFVVATGYRSELPGVRASARLTLKMFALGDTALVVALILIWIQAGNVSLLHPVLTASVASRLGKLSTVIALLVVTAALTRSAQGLLGRWMPATVSAPTPVSALLHAGVVNGGGILLLRLSALSSNSILAMSVAFTIAILTAIVATTVMSRKADVKGSLAFSTMGQMGFMLAECTAGAYIAALLHLIGHAMYKATMFFSSGSQVSRAGQAPATPAKKVSTPVRIAATTATATATLIIMVMVPGILTHHGEIILLAFVAATVAAACWSWWELCPVTPRTTIFWTIAMLGAGGLYGLAAGMLGNWIAPALPSAGSGVLSPWWLLSIVAASLAIAGVNQIPAVRNWLQALLIDIGTPSTSITGGGNQIGITGNRENLPEYVYETSGTWSGNAA